MIPYNKEPTTEEPKKKRSKKLPVFVSEEDLLEKITKRFSEIVENHIQLMRNNNSLLEENLKLMKENDELRKKSVKVQKTDDDSEQSEPSIKKEMKGEIDKGYGN